MSNKERAPLLRKDMLMCGVALIASTQLEPYLQEYTIYGQYVCYFVAGSNAITIARHLPHVMMNRLMRRRALRASINHGDARWLNKVEIKRKGLYRTDNAIFLGLCYQTGKPLFANLEPHGFLYAATGSGKTRDYFITTLLHYSGSLVTIDMKGTQAVITANTRKEKFGHSIICVNPAQLHSKQLGLSARYNPLYVIIHAWESGRTQDVITLTHEIVTQLYPQSKHKSESISTNQYFHNGTQGLLMFVILYLVVIADEPATLNAAFIILCDEDAMEDALYNARKGVIASGGKCLIR